MANCADGIFVFCYWMTWILSISYIVTFANAGWLQISDNEWRGLWNECVQDRNITGHSEKECSSLKLADGPASLECARTLSCFAIVSIAVAMFGFWCSDPMTKVETCGDNIKFRLQELCYGLTGALVVVSCGLYSDYKEEDMKDASYGYCFYMAASIGGLLVLCSLCMFCTRDKDHVTFNKNKKQKKTSPQPAITRVAKPPRADERTNWLTKKSVPTPAIQRDVQTPAVESEDVEVKPSTRFSIVTPSAVIIAMKRLKSGVKRREFHNQGAQDTEAPPPSAPAPAQTTADPKRFKGIFTVEVQNKRAKDVPVICPPVPPPPTRRDSTSSSSSSSSSTSSSPSEISVKAGAKGAVLAASNTSSGDVAQSSQHLKQPSKPRRHFSQNEAAFRSVSTTEGVVTADSKRDPDRIPRPKLSKRHQTHGEALMRSKEPWGQEAASAQGANSLNIYSIPDEPGPVPAEAPPSYDSVATGGKP